jgi:SNF2 family DNA or RNA helicase
MLDAPGAIAGWMKGEVPMLLCHPASAGHGLNLQSGGHTIVWASMTWDLELYMQANGRLDRQGQQHPVVVHKLICPGTVDEDMDARLGGKELTQDDLLDHLRSPI